MTAILNKENLLALLDRCIALAGGLRVLSRRLDWPLGGLRETTTGERSISAYRAGQLAQFAGEDCIAAVCSAQAAQARSVDEQVWWQSLARSHGQAQEAPTTVVDAREIIERVAGPKYVFVLGGAMTRAGIKSEADLRRAIPRAVAHFDANEDTFASGKSQIPIGERRQLMADYLTGGTAAS